ncbi:interleukin-7 [Xyrichtys novacula]|uniref:Interleukin-7 n=1 Tax=Xyrichtys novacula TaxID=13765 RepID=A0AAV1H8N2_XYRNO|nr:interleukin-7 [Xyrichtys novacula]
MPLLCIRLLALLLLPLSQSCESQRPPTEVRDDYMAIVQTLLIKTEENIATLLQNSTCPELRHRPQRCSGSQNQQDVVSTLHTLNCEMKNSKSAVTEKLARDIGQSIRCSCPERPTKTPNVTSKRKRSAKGEGRRKEHRKSKRERKLCKAKVILSHMTECYEMLNFILET